jgi:hypothetical protein
MLPLAAFILVYASCVTTGEILASRLQRASSVTRHLGAMAIASAQLTLSVQILSLFGVLTRGGLLVLNCAVAGLMILSRRPWRLSYDNKIGEVREFIRRAPASIAQQRISVFVWTATVIAVVAFTLVAVNLFPIGDVYHFAMPLYWEQHAGIRAFPVCNPRIIGLVFSAEAISFPNVLYLKNFLGIHVLTGCTVLASVAGIQQLSRYAGIPRIAALSAGTLLIGLGPVAWASFCGAFDVALSCLWILLALLLATEASRGKADVSVSEFGLSVLCFFLACGAKNVVLLSFPAYAAFVATLFGRRLFAVRLFVPAIAGALIGLLCSGVAWNYASNAAWFGDFRGPAVLKETVVTDLSRKAVWTRLVRCATVISLDPIWLPSRAEPAYRALVRTATKLMGASESLAEDNDFYSFSDASIRPGRGFGPLMVIALLPGLVLGLFRSTQRIIQERNTEPSRVALSLGVFSISGALITCCLLRWQEVGLARLMVPIAAAAVPLTGLLLQSRLSRAAMLTANTAIISAYFLVGLGMVARRVPDASLGGLGGRLSSAAKNRTSIVNYRWRGEPMHELEMRESYSSRELFELLLPRLHAPVTVGLIGGPNTDDFFLFGRAYVNKVVPLVDVRNPKVLLPIPQEVSVVVAQDIFGLPNLVPSEAFEPWLEIYRGDQLIFAAYLPRGAASL